MSATLPRHRLTVRDFERMAEVGIFGEDDRVELIQGEILDMAPIGKRHAACLNRLVHLFSTALGDRAVIAPQNPIQLGRDSQPQPDLAVLAFRADYYAARHPTTEDVLLLVEIAESSAAYDRDVKLPLYAAHGVPEVWLIDLTADRVERHLSPSSEGYRKILRPDEGETFSPEHLPAISLNATQVIP